MNVHNFDRDQILYEIKQIKNGICLELGVFKGEYSYKILNAGAKKLYMVDIWEGIDHDYDDATNNKNHPEAYLEALKIANLFPNNTKMIKKESEEASYLIEEESIDFLYIDANHSYENVKKDIKIWFSKVKRGGIFGGHDYLKTNWEKHIKNKFLFSDENQKILIKNENSSCSKYFKIGCFGVNSAVNEFCEINKYKLNITNDFFANWWIIK